MKTINIKSPTRVDLAGGTLDLWPLYTFIGGISKTINVAISVWTEANLTPRGDSVIEIESPDVDLKARFLNYTEFMAAQDPKLKLFQVIVSYFQPTKGFSLKSRSESPVGGGLGGSSSLTISLLKAFSQMTEKKFSSIHQLVHVAHNLEAQIITSPTGTQDYYPAAAGGLNFLSYTPEGVEQEVRKLIGSEIEKAFLLVYTGRSHHSGLNNFEVLKACVAKDEKVLKALKDLQRVSSDMIQALENGRYNEMPKLFQREYEARIQLTPAFTSPEIEKLREIAGLNNASVKICGAGGGGCVLLWAPEGKEKVADACQKAGFQIMKVNLVEPLPM